MTTKILSEKKDGTNLVYFMETDLVNLLKEINEDIFIESEEIDSIKNIIETVSRIKNNEIFPPFALAGKMFVKSSNKINNIIILDGLKELIQLKKLYEVSKFYQENKKQINEIKISFKLRKFFRENFKKNNFSSNYIVVVKKFNLVPSDFNRQQWFLFWDNLSESELIKKIIDFQKQCKKLSLMEEIIYILDYVFNIEDMINKYEKNIGNPINYYRFRDINISRFYNKKNVGDMHEGLFAIALISLICTEEINIGNYEKIYDFCKKCEKKYDKFEFEKRLKLVVKKEFIKLLIDIFWKLDKKVYEVCGAEAVKILGKKSIITKFFETFGKFLEVNDFFEGTMHPAIEDFVYELINIDSYTLKESLEYEKLN